MFRVVADIVATVERRVGIGIVITSEGCDGIDSAALYLLPGIKTKYTAAIRHKKAAI